MRLTRLFSSASSRMAPTTACTSSGSALSAAGDPRQPIRTASAQNPGVSATTQNDYPRQQNA
eukprot:1635223-Pyramimonas_sp.AAC.1